MTEFANEQDIISKIEVLTERIKESSNFEDFLTRSELYAKLGMFEKALTDSSSANSFKPDDSNVFSMIGYSYLGVGKIDDSKKMLEKSIELDSNNSKAHAYMGTLLIVLRQYKEAIEKLNISIELDASFSYAYRQRSFSRLHVQPLTEEMKKDSLLDITHCIKLEKGENSSSIIQRAYIFRKLGMLKESLDDYTRILEIVNPNSIEALENRSFVYNQLGQFEKAINDCNIAIENMVIENKNDDDDGMNNNKNKVVEVSSPTGKKNCGYDWIYSRRGFAFGKLQKYDFALEDYNFALRINPNHMFSLQQRCFIYNKLNRYSEALKDGEESLLLLDQPSSSSSSFIYSQIGFSYRNLGNNKESINYFSKSIDVAENNNNNNNNDLIFSFSQRGFTYYLLEQYDKSLEDFESSMKYILPKDDFSTCSQLQWIMEQQINVYVRTGKFRIALDIIFKYQKYEKKFELCIEEEDVDYNHRILLLNQKQIQKQEQQKNIDLENINNKTKNGFILFLKGLCFEELGMNEEAIEEYNKAISVGKCGSEVFERRRDLKKTIEEQKMIDSVMSVLSTSSSSEEKNGKKKEEKKVFEKEEEDERIRDLEDEIFRIKKEFREKELENLKLLEIIKKQELSIQLLKIDNKFFNGF